MECKPRPVTLCNMHLPVARATAGEELVGKGVKVLSHKPIVAASSYYLSIQETSLNHNAKQLQYMYTVSPLITTLSPHSLVRLVTMPHAKRLASHAQPIVAGRCLHMHYSSSDVQAFCLCCPWCICSSSSVQLFAAIAHSPARRLVFFRGGKAIMSSEQPSLVRSETEFCLRTASVRKCMRNVAARFAMYSCTANLLLPSPACFCCDEDELTNLPDSASRKSSSP